MAENPTEETAAPTEAPETDAAPEQEQEPEAREKSVYGEDGEKIVPEEKSPRPTDARDTLTSLAKSDAAERKLLKKERYKMRLRLEEEKLRAARAPPEVKVVKSQTSIDMLEAAEEAGEGGGELGEGDLEDIKQIINEADNLVVPTEPEQTVEATPEQKSDESDTPLPRLGSSLKANFIRNFDSLPSLSDISLDITEEELPGSAAAEDAEKKSSDESYSGKEDAEGEPKKEKEKGKETEKGKEKEKEKEGSGDSESDSAGDDDSDEESESFDFDLQDEEPEEPKKVEEEVDTMAMFAEVVEVQYIEKEEVEVKPEEPIWYRLVADFLKHLIKTVVLKSEGSENISNLLDKMKMIKHLQILIDEYAYEKQLNSNLNNVCCDFYRRQGKTHNFANLPEEVIDKEYYRYMTALCGLDSLLERVKLVKINFNIQRQLANIDLISSQQLMFSEEQHLEAFIRKTLTRRDMERLRRAVDYDLRGMLDMRNQISEKRYQLNLGLHSLAFVDEKSKRFEKITETLTISQMLATNASILQLGKLLEEKCKDVSVMQSHYKKTMIEETCIREKKDMLSSLLYKAKNEYSDALYRLNSLREKLTKLQSQHAKLKAHRARLEVKGGLLFKTALMYDYDDVMVDLSARRKTVAGLKKTISDLTKRISIIEGTSRPSSALRF
ncbi:hypothetical protein KR018_010824 [Drosophila ironensis]|nr:hypothetical protein KR018_010824 [Drosophila ironensis]